MSKTSGDATWQGYVAARREEKRRDGHAPGELRRKNRGPKAPAKVEDAQHGPVKRVAAQTE